MQSDLTAQLQAEKKILRFNRILRTLAGGSRALVRAATEDELFQNICRVIVETGGYRMAWVGQVEQDEEQSLRPLAHAGHENSYLALAKFSWGDNPHGRGASGLSVRTGATQFNNDIAVNPVTGAWKELALQRQYRSSISLPLRNNAGVSGALTIYADEPNAFGPEEVALLEELADDVSFAAAALHKRRGVDEQRLRPAEHGRQAAEALRRSEERYRLLVEQSVDGIFLSDEAGHYIDVNSTGREMLGYSRDEILARTLSDLLSPEEVSRLAHTVLKLSEGQLTRDHWRFRRKDGSEFVGEVVCRQLPDGNLLGILRDVSKRKQAEEDLFASEERLQLALRAGQMGIWEWDLATGACIWNEETYRILGYAPGSVTPSYQAWAQRVLLEDLVENEARLKEMVEHGVPFAAEYRALGENGQVRWLAGRGQRLVDKEGRVVRAIGVLVDITERKQADDAFRESQERITAVMENLTEGIMVAEVEGPVVYSNPAALAIFGYAGMEECRRKLADFGDTFEIRELDDDRVLPVADWPMSRVMRGEVLRDREVRLRRLDQGWEKILSYSGWLIRGAHGETLAFVSTIDITDRKATKEALVLARIEAERANVAKSKFLAAASHDLRQPAQSLTLLLSAIKRQVGDNPKTLDMVEIAKASMTSFNGMLNGILEISRLDAGVITPAMARVDLGALIGRLAREYAPRAAAGGLVLRHAPRTLHASTDVVLLERVLRNLIENALRYTAKGGVIIGVRRRGEFVRLDVIDTGMGIPADQQTEIFEEFRQLNNPARDSTQGLGLGLAIVSRLSHLIGAEVLLASRLDRGTRFSLLLPLDRSAPAPVRIAPAFDDARGRILVIEDNAFILQAYEIMLNEWGYQMLRATSGEEALVFAAQEKGRFDAIIADHRLGPGLTGSAAALEIARRAKRKFPTMVVTGDTAGEQLTEITASGFTMLHKPVDPDDLRRKLAALLRGDEGNDRPPASSATCWQATKS